MHPLAALARLDGVAAAVDEAREACTALRWHRALRRQWPVARAEAGVRAVQAGLELDGVRLPLDLVRDVARGAAAPPDGVVGETLMGALRVQAEVERRLPAPGATGTAAASAPLAQLIARWHALASPTAPGVPGRPRDAHTDAAHPPGSGTELRGLGPAPSAAVAGARLRALGELVAEPLPAEVPALVLVAIVHGELLHARPFVSGNAVVARAAARHLLTVRGVDPTGVVVPEVVWAASPTVHLAGAAGYATGEPARVAAWLVHWAHAVVRGAGMATDVADAVLAGRLADGQVEGRR